jgi:hypothetical protein
MVGSDVVMALASKLVGAVVGVGALVLVALLACGNVGSIGWYIGLVIMLGR